MTILILFIGIVNIFRSSDGFFQFSVVIQAKSNDESKIQDWHSTKTPAMCKTSLGDFIGYFYARKSMAHVL